MPVRRSPNARASATRLALLARGARALGFESSCSTPWRRSRPAIRSALAAPGRHFAVLSFSQAVRITRPAWGPDRRGAEDALARLRRPWFAGGGTVTFVSVGANLHRCTGPGDQAGFEDGHAPTSESAALATGFAMIGDGSATTPRLAAAVARPQRCCSRAWALAFTQNGCARGAVLWPPQRPFHHASKGPSNGAAAVTFQPLGGNTRGEPASVPGSRARAAHSGVGAAKRLLLQTGRRRRRRSGCPRNSGWRRAWHRAAMEFSAVRLARVSSGARSERCGSRSDCQ